MASVRRTSARHHGTIVLAPLAIALPAGAQAADANRVVIDVKVAQ